MFRLIYVYSYIVIDPLSSSILRGAEPINATLFRMKRRKKDRKVADVFETNAQTRYYLVTIPNAASFYLHFQFTFTY